MANANSTSRNTQSVLLEAVDKLDESKALVTFVQSISLNVRAGEAVTLEPAQLAGFYYVLKNAIDGMNEVGALIDEIRAQSEEAIHA